MKSRSIPALIMCAPLCLDLAACSWCVQPPTHTPGFGELMTHIESRHAKLWFAGQARNWSLAAYELDELKEGLEDVSKFHPTHKTAPLPVPKLIADMMTKPVDQLESSIKAGNQGLFKQNYDALTTACNSCHQASSFGFVVVTRPLFNTFPNQAFTPSH